ncbi:chalcone isomerase family protein [Aquimarina sp. W85]|uniref:chalcone isomerase family protein n=1 Tax=Aquimarina rhodophyticola TaxID=3342246 RepID=UPI00366F6271
MKNLFLVFFGAISLIATGQTKVGEVFFNDIDVFEGAELMLNGAGEKERMYALGLYLDFEVEGVEDGSRVANKDSDMVISIKIISSSIDGTDLKDMLRNGIERATDGNSYLLENEIRDFIKILPTEINKYDIFKIVYKKGGNLSLYRNKDKLGQINSLKFKKALFKIWLGENPVDEKLKEAVLASYTPNPILGRWKTYDKDTGVAINIVQLYMIEKQIFGSIQRMLRQSERDAVCHLCKGDDKNQKVEGLLIMKNLKHSKDFKYENGKYTDIKTGEVSDCDIWIDEDEMDVLNVKYKGGGGTHKWKRVKDTE